MAVRSTARVPAMVAVTLLALLVGAAVPASADYGQPRFPVTGTLGELPEPAFVPGEVLVRFRAGTDRRERADVRSDVGLPRKDTLPLPRMELLHTRDRGAEAVPAAVRALERRPEVLYAEPNYVHHPEAAPNDSYFAGQWGLHNTGQAVQGVSGTPDADIDAPEAWDITTGSDSVTVAVVDTGIRPDHPDLEPNMWTNPDETGGGRETNRVDDDANTYVDDWRGWDWHASPDDNDPADASGHGTMVAGVIGARGGDGRGVSGVSQRVKLMSLRARASSEIIDAFRYAAREGARVINGSFGRYGPPSLAVCTAIEETDALFVFSSGNEDTDNDTQPHWPSNCPGSNVLAVAMSDQNDGFDGNHGATSVDLAAPGRRVLTTEAASDLLFNDDFETPLTGRWTPVAFTGRPWDRTPEAHAGAAGSFSVTDSPGSLYDANSFTYLELVNPLSLAGRRNCQVIYDRRLNLGSGDQFAVEARGAGPSWQYLEPLVGGPASNSGVFTSAQSDLAPFEGRAEVHLRLTFSSDASDTRDGVWIDNLSVRCFDAAYGTFGSEFSYANGTSFAAPHVAGVGALVFAQRPSANVAEVRQAILSSVDPVESHAGRTVTGGRLNALRALGGVERPPPPPDRDGDGVPDAGDRCPDENPGGVDVDGDGCVDPPPPPLLDTIPPTITGLRVTPSAFRPLRRGTSVVRRGGTRVGFHLSEYAALTFYAERRTLGRRLRGASCSRPTRTNRRGRRCFYYVRVPRSFFLELPAGANVFRFSGTLGGRPLPPGSYRLAITARDMGANVSRFSAPFRVLRR